MTARPMLRRSREPEPRRKVRLALAELARQVVRGEDLDLEQLDTAAASLPLCSLGPVRTAELQQDIDQIRAAAALGQRVSTRVSRLEADFGAAVRAADGGIR